MDKRTEQAFAYLEKKRTQYDGAAEKSCLH